jgi:CheY-like chemotaxis protein
MATILCIDDRVENLDYLELFLSNRGFDTLTTLTGLEGIKLAKQHQPDLILVDVMMPEALMTGPEAARIMKSDPNLCHIPIIAISGSANWSAASEAGCDAFIMRPTRPAELLDTIQQLLTAREPVAE